MEVEEEVAEKVKNFAFQTVKLTGRGIWNAYQKEKNKEEAEQKEFKAKIDNKIEKKKDIKKSEKRAEKAERKAHPRGKQTVKQLIGQNAGVEHIDIDNTGIRDFKKYANRFGVDYAITKDKSKNPPVYTVFFKGRDADAINRAFSAYSSEVLRKKDRPSVLKQLRSLAEKAREKAHGPFEKNREKSRSTEETR